MTYTLTVRYRVKKKKSDIGWLSVSCPTEQKILPQVGGTVALLYMDGKQPNVHYFKVEDVIYYPQKKVGTSLDVTLGRRSADQGDTEVQVVVGDGSIDERVINLITSPNNKFSLGNWSNNEKKQETA